MRRKPTVYILTNKPSGVLYTGTTAHPGQRKWQHDSKLNPDSFTAKYNLNLLVYMEHHATMPIAIKREKEIKSWSRARKVDLIESINPDWSDLSNWLLSLE